MRVVHRALVAGLCLCLGNPVASDEESRIVSIGGAVTEIVYALGAKSTLVGCDITSEYPAAAADLPKIGYQRRFSSEGVLSLNPSLVIASHDAGPPTAIAQVQEAGVPVTVVSGEHSVEGVRARIREIAKAVRRESRGEELIAQVEHDLAQTRAFLDGQPKNPKVIFIYARGQGTLLVAGQETSANSMIQLAGGMNPITQYTGYKTLTAESVVAAAPDVIVMMSSGLESLGTVDDLVEAPGLSLTPAGKGRRVVAMDGLYLLGFGPRTGKAAKELAQRLADAIAEGGES